MSAVPYSEQDILKEEEMIRMSAEIYGRGMNPDRGNILNINLTEQEYEGQ